MQKPTNLIIPLPFQNINQRHDRLGRRPRAILRLVLRAEIRLREAGIVREDLDAERSVLDPLARGDHAERGLARPVLQSLEFVRRRGRIEAAVDGADSAGDIHDARRRGRFLKKGRECVGHDGWAGCVGVEGVAHLLAQWRGEGSDACVVDEECIYT